MATNWDCNRNLFINYQGGLHTRHPFFFVVFIGLRLHDRAISTISLQEHKSGKERQRQQQCVSSSIAWVH
ncbi:MAG: hypothetical protein NW224_07650 [Leptolyngbyaceae cyanobacterium bins.302]|nr:hypothetical protein [Leptolyngbyaceae cyanobacterium bins.302]